MPQWASAMQRLVTLQVKHLLLCVSLSMELVTVSAIRELFTLSIDFSVEYIALKSKENL